MGNKSSNPPLPAEVIKFDYYIKSSWCTITGSSHLLYLLEYTGSDEYTIMSDAAGPSVLIKIYEED